MYRATPTHTYEYKGTAPDNIKVQKERLSILFCANMSGSDKMKPVVIGKFENLVALEPSEPTEESEQEKPDIQADVISKQKAIEYLNILQQYFMTTTAR